MNGRLSARRHRAPRRFRFEFRAAVAARRVPPSAQNQKMRTDTSRRRSKSGDQVLAVSAVARCFCAGGGPPGTSAIQERAGQPGAATRCSNSRKASRAGLRFSGRWIACDSTSTLGATAVGLLRERVAAGASWQRASLRLEPRSAYLLQGPARAEWEHSIPRTEGLRHSVTSRTLRVA